MPEPKLEAFTLLELSILNTAMQTLLEEHPEDQSPTREALADRVFQLYQRHRSQDGQKIVLVEVRDGSETEGPLPNVVIHRMPLDQG